MGHGTAGTVTGRSGSADRKSEPVFNGGFASCILLTIIDGHGCLPFDSAPEWEATGSPEVSAKSAESAGRRRDGAPIPTFPSRFRTGRTGWDAKRPWSGARWRGVGLAGSGSTGARQATREYSHRIDTGRRERGPILRFCDDLTCALRGAKTSAFSLVPSPGLIPSSFRQSPLSLQLRE
jgi:hypothetical protein